MKLSQLRTYGFNTGWYSAWVLANVVMRLLGQIPWAWTDLVWMALLVYLWLDNFGRGYSPNLRTLKVLAEAPQVQPQVRAK